jgi:hypothetical protein
MRDQGTSNFSPALKSFEGSTSDQIFKAVSATMWKYLCAVISHCQYSRPTVMVQCKCRDGQDVAQGEKETIYRNKIFTLCGARSHL